MIFFFSKKVFRCHSCSPATDKQTASERILIHAILEFVDLFSSCISSSLSGSTRTHVKGNSTRDNILVSPWIRWVDKTFNITCHEDRTSHHGWNLWCLAISLALAPSSAIRNTISPSNNTVCLGGKTENAIVD